METLKNSNTEDKYLINNILSFVELDDIENGIANLKLNQNRMYGKQN